jgi:glycosyltransferase involved in cell wall biosynthesis
VLPVTAIVLTLNEERNLRACLESVAPFVERILVVDSGSRDGTREIAEHFGCGFHEHEWKNYATQFQWALDNLPIASEWVLRLDADERWRPEGFAELAAIIRQPDVAGVYVRMQIFFMSRWMKHGGVYPNDFLRVFRRSGAFIEQRWMDEHIRVAGRAVSSRIDVIEANYDRQSNLGLWIAKHNSYSTREAADVITEKYGVRALDSVAALGQGKTERKRWVKERIYYRLPLFVRPFLYFFYRYVLRMGFLDGIPGFVFSVLQGFWYRFVVDAKVYQLEREAQRNGKPIADVVRETYGIDL